MSKKITRRLGTTLSFTRHLKLVHLAKYKEYFESSRSAGNENQRNIHSFFASATQSPESSSLKYGVQYPRRKLINESIGKTPHCRLFTSAFYSGELTFSRFYAHSQTQISQT